MLNLQGFIETFYQATQLPISIFEGNALLYKGEHLLQDYNLPLYLVSSLSDSLPDIWYSSTPEYLFFGGLDISCHFQTPTDDAPVSAPPTGDIPSRHLLLLGPVFVNPCSRSQAEAIMVRLGRKLSDAASFAHSMKHVPLVSATQLAAYLTLLSTLLTGQPASQAVFTDFKWAHIFPSRKELPLEVASYTADMDNLESTLLSMIRNGKVREMRVFFNESPLYHNPEAASHTGSLTIRRNYILGANAVASRIAMSAGVAPALIHALSSSYMDEISKTTSLSELSLIFKRFMLDYADQVYKMNRFPFEGQLARNVNRHVQSHLYEKLSTSLIARALGFNPSYLSTSFKESTGMTVTDFIVHEKIKEAKYLLDCHTYTLPEISQLLCFSSQSYFGSVFRKITGQTPLEYQMHPDSD